MKIDLERQDIQNILVALNSVRVSGKEQMLAVLQLIVKLETALQPEGGKDAAE